MAKFPQDTRILEVAIMCGRGLASKDSNGLSDPFVVAKYAGKQVYKTRVVDKSLAPTWAADERAFVVGGSAGGMLLEVWDHDVLSPPEFMGQCAAPTARGASVPPFALWMPLTHRGGHPEEVVSGELCLASRLMRPERLGVLRKRGRKKDARDCLCAVTADWLLFWKDEAGAEVRRAVPLSGAEISESKGSFSVSVSRPHKKVWTFSAPTHAESAEWAAALRTHVRAPRGIFGATVQEVVSHANALGDSGVVPPFLTHLLADLQARGVREEGVLRLGGDERTTGEAVRRSGELLPLFLGTDPLVHNVTGVLKRWLRKMPQPLMTFDLYEPLMRLMESHARDEDPSLLTSLLRRLVEQLPNENAAVLRAICSLLFAVSHHSEVNKMTAYNLAVAIGPSLAWCQHEDPVAATMNVINVVAATEALTTRFVAVFQVAGPPASLASLGAGGNSKSVGEIKRMASTARPPPPAPLRLRSAARPSPGRPSAGGLRAGVIGLRSSQLEEQARELFNVYDFDKSGALDLDEFMAFMGDLLQVSPHLAARFTHEAVIDVMQVISQGEMMISLESFMAWWRELNTPQTPPRPACFPPPSKDTIEPLDEPLQPENDIPPPPGPPPSAVDIPPPPV